MTTKKHRRCTTDHGSAVSGSYVENRRMRTPAMAAPTTAPTLELPMTASRSDYAPITTWRAARAQTQTR